MTSFNPYQERHKNVFELGCFDSELDKLEKEIINSEHLTQLIILDVNGLLCCKVEKIHYEDTNSKREFRIDPHNSNNENVFQTQNKSSYIQLRNYRVYARSNVRNFVDKLLQNYQVAIFSSTADVNLNKILPWLLGKSILEKMSFIWCRSRTEIHLPDGPHKTVKKLENIWKSEEVNPDNIWNSYNTLIIDDDPSKIRFNLERNNLVWDPWYISDKEQTSNLENLYSAIQKKTLELLESLKLNNENQLIQN